ncbi:similar to Saccharomyces cerevisiae YJL200C ACO2 Putative mitochondrial aconitase isozyme [Maudiozyma barnettii]|uniref:Aconitate hydratase, mitochondrial n=1 Tax=Maudiozyma barnettii TaxID=61262 RepID=A0A8H2ZHE9_9SACH|nr:aconitate hydratase ACO2 [Kazachstania barnettii]CAB4254693.1 similar to Saccharomyces cerevisiae YJL200C ACO2 Putative mitochondrial aconitase isozyme [Kazachstania barnettii]CAD1782735.1 similar to Saccharomyces cerevisiae YJL200C ACO2 Putative mitochondrial aconitase isozyme [Kazachstania barnettii]
MLSARAVARRNFASFSKIPNVSKDLQSRVPPYAKLLTNLEKVHKITNNEPLTLAEKILYSHLTNPEESLGGSTGVSAFRDIRGKEYLKLSPDRVAMQDASAQMAMLQFMTTGLPNTSVPTSIHCDHLVVGKNGEEYDLPISKEANKEVFDFLESCSKKYGITFWGPGSGIIHQIVLENYSAPGLMMLGTDSHTPNAGGLGAIAIGVGGADAVDAMTATPWELKAPKVMGVKLTGKLSGWSAPKDIITTIAGKLTVRGGTGYILEYFGEGVDSLSCTGMATICNMGAEVGATTSLFPYNDAHRRYLAATGRKQVADAADVALNEYNFLKSDQNAQYDDILEINLSELEPTINGPFTPDLSTKVSEYAETSLKENWPQNISVGLIGSCTNSSYQDMSRVIDLVNQAAKAGLKPKIPFFVTPGSEQIRATLERDGIMKTFTDNGAIVLGNACGPCIGQWDRGDVPKDTKQTNSIFTSFNRNFRARNDGNRNTMNFLTSPEIVTAMIYSGDAQFNPLKNSITTPDGKKFTFKAPKGDELPQRGFEHGRDIFYPENDPKPNAEIPVKVSPDSDRLQLLEPFKPWDGKELKTTVLLKVKGKCTTDHISAAGVWLKYKGHLENISYNTLIGAQNYETDEVNKVYDLDGKGYDIPGLMMKWKDEQRPWVVLAEHNYGEGSAREHAALSPRYLGGEIILVKSFARIHETNLKKQGMLPLTFADEADFDKICSGDVLETVNLADMVAKNGDNGGELDVKVTKRNGETFIIKAKHTMSKDQINFFKAGSAINFIGEQRRNV